MSTGQFKYLFTPINLGPMTVKNRLVFMPHTHGYCLSGFPDERLHHYLAERAKGGVGLIIEGGYGVHESTQGKTTMDAFDHRIVSGLRRISDAVHQYDTKIICQFRHVGAEGIQDRRAMWAPSAVADAAGMNEMPKPMEEQDIKEVVSGYVKAALHAKEGGYDGVEIKIGHDGLLREFGSPASNFRNDEFGGNLDNRLKILMDILKAVREVVGTDFVVGMRPCLDELKPGGYNLEEGLEISRAAADSGLIDYLSSDVATAGAGFHLTNPPMDMPLGCNVWAAAALREAVSLPVIAAARINDPVQAERILADGHADMVGMARQLICDPETPNKAKEGRIDDIRHCMACNQGCFGNLATRGYIRCVQNPAVSNEETLGSGTLKMAAAKKVVIVGGGPAGMKAAEIAARRGHQVTLYEKAAELGGQVKLAEKGPKREDFGEVVRWLQIQVGKLGVKVVTNVEATPEIIEAQKPDSVIIATGARPVKPPIPGAEQQHVVTTWDVLTGSAKVRQNVLVFCTWRNQAAASVAELLANQGKHVEIVTPAPFFGTELSPGCMVPLYQRLTSKGVTFTPFTTISQIGHDTVTLRNVFSQQEHVRSDIDTVVLSTHAKANDELYLALKGKVPLQRVGDCIAPRDIDSAIYEGEMAGRAL